MRELGGAWGLRPFLIAGQEFSIAPRSRLPRSSAPGFSRPAGSASKGAHAGRPCWRCSLGNAKMRSPVSGRGARRRGQKQGTDSATGVFPPCRSASEARAEKGVLWSPLFGRPRIEHLFGARECLLPEDARAAQLREVPDQFGSLLDLVQRDPHLTLVHPRQAEDVALAQADADEDHGLALLVGDQVGVADTVDLGFGNDLAAVAVERLGLVGAGQVLVLPLDPDALAGDQHLPRA